MVEPCTWTIHEARKQLTAGKISARELTAALLARIERTEPKVMAYNTVVAESALSRADAADRDKGRAALSGIGLAIKDNMATEGVETTCSSRILKGFLPPYTGTAVRKLWDAGALMLGKANMDEFAMGSSTENSATHLTRNPWALDRTPGGSSGGSAAAVAADMCLGALGSDTGGSIRQPAGLCGVVGLKPTYGRVSRYGLVAFASSLDQIGPLTKDVEDAAILLAAISGRDPLDATTADQPVPDFLKDLNGGVAGLTLGIPREYFIDGADPKVLAQVKAGIDVLVKRGAKVKEVSLPHTAYAVACYYLIAPAEASSNLSRYDGVRYGARAGDPKDLLDMYMRTRDDGFGPEVKRRIMLGTYALSAGYYDAYYKKAQQVRTLILKDFTEAFREVDVLVTPTSPTGAFKLGERTSDPLQMYLSDIFTISANLAGLPAISIPCGFDGNRCPVGMQIIGRAFDEATVLRTARAFEAQTDHHLQKPSL